MSVHFSNLYGIFKNSSYHVSKEKTSAQRQKRKKPLLGRPIFTLNLYSLVAVLRNQGRCFLSVIPSSYRHGGPREDAAMLFYYHYNLIHFYRLKKALPRHGNIPAMSMNYTM